MIENLKKIMDEKDVIFIIILLGFNFKLIIRNKFTKC